MTHGLRTLLTAAIGGTLLVANVPALDWQSFSGERDALIGTWVLNRELSSEGMALDPGGGAAGMRARPRGGTAGGRGGRGGGARPDAAAVKRAREVVQEVMTPTPRWVIARGESDALSFTDAEGRTMRFVPDDKAEKHHLTAGTIETKTKWDNGALRQEITAGGMTLVRSFSVIPETRQLIVMMVTSGRRAGPNPPRFVYEIR